MLAVKNLTEGYAQHLPSLIEDSLHHSAEELFVATEIGHLIAGRRAGDIAECYADPSRAEELLGWKAEFDLKKMCRDSWNFIAKNMKQS